MEPLDFSEIMAFLKVVDSGSYTKAAALLGSSKSSVSRKVAQLERRLGVPLLRRSTRSLGLTEEGSAFHARVAHAVLEVSDAAQHVRDLQGTPRGHLRVTAPTDLGPELGRMTVAFCAKYPDVTLEMMLTQRAVDLVREGFDLAIRAGPMPDSNLMARRITSGHPRLYASPTYLEARGTPKTPEDLEGHSCVLFQAPTLKQKWPLQGPDGLQAVEVTGRISTNHFSMLTDILLEGAGVGVLPPQFAAPHLRSGKLVCVLPGYGFGEAALHIVYPGGRNLSAKVRVFRDFARSWLAASVDAASQ